MTKKHELSYRDNSVTVDGNSWTTEKPVVDGTVKNETVLLIFDYGQYPDNKVARNLEGYTLDGQRLWIAENPVDTANEAYVEFIVSDDEPENNIVEVGDLAGFHCSIDSNTGKLVNVVYEK